MGTPRVPRFTNGLTIGKGQCGARSGLSDNQERDWRLSATLSSAALLAAQNELADKIEREMLGCSREERATKTALESVPHISKFEADMLAIKNGAPIREEAPMPRRAEPTYSLIGIGSALL